jgi:hypothetical protein
MNAGCGEKGCITAESRVYQDLNPGITSPEFCYTTRTFVFGHDREQVGVL